MNFYTGFWIAVVTPFKNGQIDEAALQNLVADLANRGADGFVPLGTTGEASCLSMDERRKVIKLVLEAAKGCPVSPGCGTNATAQTIELVKDAEALKLGAGGDGHYALLQQADAGRAFRSTLKRCMTRQICRCCCTMCRAGRA
jgi:dihydrodipicolinate synthase/N-acetylneuraminate lyase